MAAESDNRQPWANNQVLIAVLILVVIGAGLGLYFGLHKSGHSKPKGFAIIGPVALTAQQLKHKSATLQTPIYWAGPQAGYEYEFTRDVNGYLYVRYLPLGTQAGTKHGHFLVISTYPLATYNGLKNEAGNHETPGPNHSIIYVRPHTHRRNVLMAFKDSPNVQVEIYDFSPAIAISTATSGKVKPVRAAG